MPEPPKWEAQAFFTYQDVLDCGNQEGCDG